MVESTLFPSSEVALLSDTETAEINSRLGLVLIGHDAIAFGVTEEIIAYVLERLRDKCPSVGLGGVEILDSIAPEQVKQIYPDLHRGLLDAFVKVFGQKSSVLVAFQQTDPQTPGFNFIDEINRIKGKTERHRQEGSTGGWKKSIRSAIPLPGDRKRYEETDKKLDQGELSPDDYIKLTYHLVHSPDNEIELAGLYLLLGEDTKREMLGENVKVYDRWVQKFTVKK